MQVGDLIRHTHWDYVAIVTFVAKEAIEVYKPSTGERVWINNFIHSKHLEKLCKSET